MYSPSLRIAPEQSVEYYGPAHPHSHVRPSIRLDRPISKSPLVLGERFGSVSVFDERWRI
jgi:hypothetical protein